MAAKKTSASKTSGKAAAKKLKAASKKAAPKKSAVKKTVAQKASAKKASVKKAGLKKFSVKKTAIKKTSVKNATVKKASVTNLGSKKPIAKAAVQKPATKKAAAKTAIIRKPAVKNVAAARPASVAAGVSKPATRGTTPSKSTGGAGKKRIRQNRLNLNPPPLSPVRRPATVVSRSKMAKELPPKLANSVRVPIRPATAPRRAARSAARGMAPGAAQASAPIDQKPRRGQKPKHVIDEALSEQKLKEAIRTAVLYLEAWLKSGDVDVTQDHDNFGRNRSKIMNVIDSSSLERDASEKPPSTFSSPAPALSKRAGAAEAARAQIWRWLDREAPFDNGQALTPALLQDALNREMDLLREDMGAAAFDTGLFVRAAQLFLDLALAPDFEDFPGAAIHFAD